MNMLTFFFLLSSLSLGPISCHTHASSKGGLSVDERRATRATGLVKWDIRLDSPPPPPPAVGVAELWPSMFVNFSSALSNNTGGASVGHHVRSLFDTDLFETPASTIKAISHHNITPICYFSAGTYESWRPDAHLFPSSVIGQPLADWPGESYVDIRSPIVRKLTKARIEMAWEKGCGGVDPDNVDGFELDEPSSRRRDSDLERNAAGAAETTGFNLTQQDAVGYVRWLCHQTKLISHGAMLCGLKNAPELIPQVINGEDAVDFAVVEECVRYGTCGEWRGMVERGLPVLGIEYPFEGGMGDGMGEGKGKEGLVKKWCGFGDGKGKGGRIGGMSTVLKKLELGSWGVECPYY